MSTPPVVSHQYTPEDLLTMPDGHRFDLVDGHLVERHMGAESSWIAQQVNRRLGNDVAASQGGLVLGPDCGYQIFPDDPNQVRFPDGSFIRRGRLPHDVPPRGHVRIVPDLLIEVVSPNDLAWEVEVKVTEYLRAGVPLLWVFYPDFSVRCLEPVSMRFPHPYPMKVLVIPELPDRQSANSASD